MNLEVVNGGVVDESRSVIVIFVSGNSRIHFAIVILVAIRGPISDNIRFGRQWRHPRNYNAFAMAISLCYVDLQIHRNNQKNDEKRTVSEHLRNQDSDRARPVPVRCNRRVRGKLRRAYRRKLQVSS